MANQRPESNTSIAFQDNGGAVEQMERRANDALTNWNTNDTARAEWLKVVHAYMLRIPQDMTPAAHMASAIVAANMLLAKLADHWSVPDESKDPLRRTIELPSGPRIKFVAEGVSSVDVDALERQFRSLALDMFKDIADGA